MLLLFFYFELYSLSTVVATTMTNSFMWLSRDPLSMCQSVFYHLKFLARCCNIQTIHCLSKVRDCSRSATVKLSCEKKMATQQTI